jgi:predicted PurR-regulated permease PerM
MQAIPSPRLAGALIPVAAGVIVLAGLHAFADFVAMMGLSILVAILLGPVRARLIGRGVGRGLALLACLTLYVVVLGVAGILVVVGLAGFLRDLPALHASLDDAVTKAQLDVIDGDAIEAMVRGMAAAMVGAVATVGYSVIIVAYLLLDADAWPVRIRRAFPNATGLATRAVTLANRLRAYIVARIILGGVAAILDVIALVILGVPNALLWGILSFLLSFIPNVGFILALIPPTIVGLLVGGWQTAVLVVIAYVVINTAIDYVVQPRYVGGQVDISPVIVTVSIVFWTVVLGGAGALLAVPLTIVSRAIFDGFDDARGLAVMLGGDPEGEV